MATEVKDLKAIADANKNRIEQYRKTRAEFSVGGSPWDYSEIPEDRDISDLFGLEDEEVEKSTFTGVVTAILEDKARTDKNGNTIHTVIVSTQVGRAVLTAIGPMYDAEKGMDVTFTGVAVAKGAEFLHLRSERNGGGAVIITANRAHIKAFGFFS